jgi:hypothetical protein
MHYDHDEEDYLEPSPYRPLFPWREVTTFTITMIVLVWICVQFWRYVWGYFFG